MNEEQMFSLFDAITPFIDEQDSSLLELKKDYEENKKLNKLLYDVFLKKVELLKHTNDQLLVAFDKVLAVLKNKGLEV